MYDGKWIEDKLNELADATRIDGEIWRAAYTREDRIAKEMLRGWMTEAGLTVREDAVGNLIGRLEGESPGTFLTASHLDTVKNGGKYDGAAGIITAVATLGGLARSQPKPALSVETAVLMEEEVSRYHSSYIGSRAMMGRFRQKDLDEKDTDGVTLSEALSASGHNPGHVAEAHRKDIRAYMELHIEQGPMLERNGASIGIVENIVGLAAMTVRLKSEQGHAGTTLMIARKDPVVQAARMICDMTAFAEQTSKTATLTVGRINASPGMSNVVAGEAEFSIDARDGERDHFLSLVEFVERSIQEAPKKGFAVEVVRECMELPVKLDERMVRTLDGIVRDLGIPFMRMNSGAGHDAQIFAEHLPVCMIFVPSRNGVSHSPSEYTSPDDLDKGRMVMERALQTFAWQRPICGKSGIAVSGCIRKDIINICPVCRSKISRCGRTALYLWTV